MQRVAKKAVQAGNMSMKENSCYFHLVWYIIYSLTETLIFRPSFKLFWGPVNLKTHKRGTNSYHFPNYRKGHSLVMSMLKSYPGDAGERAEMQRWLASLSKV